MFKDSLQDEGKKLKKKKQAGHTEKNLSQSLERGDEVPPEVASCPK